MYYGFVLLASPGSVGCLFRSCWLMLATQGISLFRLRDGRVSLCHVSQHTSDVRASSHGAIPLGSRTGTLLGTSLSSRVLGSSVWAWVGRGLGLRARYRN